MLPNILVCHINVGTCVNGELLLFKIIYSMWIFFVELKNKFLEISQQTSVRQNEGIYLKWALAVSLEENIISHSKCIYVYENLSSLPLSHKNSSLTGCSSIFKKCFVLMHLISYSFFFIVFGMPFPENNNVQCKRL